MPAGIPSTCPKCGSGRVGKEYIMGAQTGDWMCGACKHTDSINRSEYRPPEPAKDSE